MPATVVGTEEVLFPTGQASVSAQITVPANVTVYACVAAFIPAGGTVSNFTLAGAQPDESDNLNSGGSGSDFSMVGAWHNAPSGTQTLAAVFSGTPTQGCRCIAVYVQNALTVGNGADAASGNTQLTINLPTGQAAALEIVWEERLGAFPDDRPPPWVNSPPTAFSALMGMKAAYRTNGPGGAINNMNDSPNTLIHGISVASAALLHPIEIIPESGWSYTTGTSTTPADPVNNIPFGAIGDQVLYESTATNGGTVTVAGDGSVSITGSPVPGSTSFQYRYYTDASETWSLPATYTWQSGAISAPVADLHHAHTITPVGAVTRGTLEDLHHDHAITEPLLTTAGAVEPLDHAHTLDAVALTKYWLVAPEDLPHAHSLEAPTAIRTVAVAVQDLAHSHMLTEPSASTGILADPANLTHPHSLGAPTVQVRFVRAVQDLAHGHAIGDTQANKRTLVVVSGLFHSVGLTTPVTNLQAAVDKFPGMIEDSQRLVLKHLGEVMIIGSGTEILGIFEAEWFDPTLGPAGFEAASTYVEFLDEDTGGTRLNRGDQVARRRDGKTYTVKEVRKEEFAFTRYILEDAA